MNIERPSDIFVPLCPVLLDLIVSVMWDFSLHILMKFVFLCCFGLVGFFKFFSESRLAQSQVGMCRHVYIRWKLVSIGDGQTGCKNCDETGEAIKAISVSCIKRLVHAASQDRRLVYNMYIRFNLKHLDFPLTLVSLCRKSRQSERRQRDSCSSKSLNPVSL